MSPNQKIIWSDTYKLGIDMIDIQHIKLFELVNRLYDLEEGENVKEKLRVILYEFSDYMSTHFKDEEEYMSSIGYPALEEHKQLHNDIIEYLSQVIQTPAKLSIIKSKMRVVAKRILIDHITQEDTKILLYKMENENEEIFDISDIETT